MMALVKHSMSQDDQVHSSSHTDEASGSRDIASAV